MSVKRRVYDLYGDTWGLEKTYHSAKKAYQFLGHPDQIQIRQHVFRHTTAARDIEHFFDFLDTQFGIKKYPPFMDFYHPYNYKNWRKQNEEIEEKPLKVDLKSKQLTPQTKKINTP